MREKVQILVATYNGERFLEQQLDSLLNQTYENIEILCRDDGSVDGTTYILDKYAKVYPEKVRIIKDDKKTGGATGNFMRLLKIADADYVMFCDQDDYWFPGKVEESYLCIQEECLDRDIPVLVFSDYIVTDQTLKPLGDNQRNSQVYKAHTDLRHLLVQNYVTGCTSMLNKALYKSMLTDSPEILMHDWWAAICATSSGKVVHLNKTLMYYRQHEENCVGAVDIRSREYILSRIKDPKAKTSMKSYIEQAKVLLNNYPLLNEESKHDVENFIDIAEHKKVMRCVKLAKGRYYKSTLPRIIGQFLYI